MKAIIFDSSSLISISMNGLFEELKELKKLFGEGNYFIITESVKKEIIDNPLHTPQFELEGLRLDELLSDGVLSMPSALGVSNKEINTITNEMLDKANNIFKTKNGGVNLIHDGEASCMALGRILQKKKIDFVFCIDERNTRMLIEKPENLEELLEKKMHTSLKLEKNNFKFFEDFKIIRSTELMYIAWKKGLLKMKTKNGVVLDAVLYALKFKGCSISDNEIAEMKKIK